MTGIGSLDSEVLQKVEPPPGLLSVS